jgi:hypothetical protein
MPQCPDEASRCRANAVTVVSECRAPAAQVNMQLNLPTAMVRRKREMSQVVTPTTQPLKPTSPYRRDQLR